MEPLSSRKIGKLSSETRLAASWGPKIAQIGSLARWKIVIPGHPWMRGLLELVASRPLRLQDQHAQNGEKLWLPSWELRTLSEEVLEGQGARLECPEAARGNQESPGSAQERLKNGAAELQKNWTIEL